MTVTAALLYLLAAAPAEPGATMAGPHCSGSWLLHLKLAWMPRFGIAFELAMDGLSLLLLV